MKIELGNVGIGEVFAYDGALFVSLPFNWEENAYKNLCIAVRNPFEYNSGDEYIFPEDTLVEFVTENSLKTLIP